MRFTVKVLLGVGLFAVGLWLLLAHAGLAIPRLTYQGFEAYELPAGFGFVIAGILVLWLWKIQESNGDDDANDDHRRGRSEDDRHHYDDETDG